MNFRYAVVRESDNRFVVIDKQENNRWVYGPASQESARKIVKKLNDADKEART